MGSILNDNDRTAICQRISSVTNASVPRWGQMDAKAMLTHLKQSALMALGELPVASKSKRVFQIFPVKHLILHVVPFPKGAPTAPELLVPDTASVDAIRDELVSLVEASGPGRVKGMGRFTRCLAVSHSASGAWRHTSIPTITCVSSGLNVRRG